MTTMEDKSVSLALQPMTANNGSTFSASLLDDSPAPSAAEDQLDFLNDPNSLEQETLFLSVLDTSSPALAVGPHGDEFCCLLEHFDRWSSPLDPMMSPWNPRCLQQKDSVDMDVSHSPLTGDLVASKEEEVREEEKADTLKVDCVSPVAVKAEMSGKRIWKGDQSVITKSSSKFRPSKPSDSSENSEDELSIDTRTASKNLVSERRRRKKLNERLYSLRALVPKISKMDKASIVSDAISYVQELQKQVESIEADIQVLQSNRDSPQQRGCLHDANHGLPRSQRKSSTIEHRILELEVAQMEEQTYHVRIHCKKGPGVLVQLTKALEALDFEIINANLTSVNDHILNNVVVKARAGEVLTPEALKKLTLEIVPRFGLVF